MKLFLESQIIQLQCVGLLDYNGNRTYHLNVNYLWTTLAAFFTGTVLFMFQNCSTDFGNANDPANRGQSVYTWVLVYGACSVQCATGTQTPVAV